MERKIVFVRVHDGRFRRFVLLETAGRAAFVCREDAYEAIVRGIRERPMTGFPIEDVFEPSAPLDAAELNPGDPREAGLIPLAHV